MKFSQLITLSSHFVSNVGVRKFVSRKTKINRKKLSEKTHFIDKNVTSVQKQIETNKNGIIAVYSVVNSNFLIFIDLIKATLVISRVAVRKGIELLTNTKLSSICQIEYFFKPFPIHHSTVSFYKTKRHTYSVGFSFFKALFAGEQAKTSPHSQTKTIISCFI